MRELHEEERSGLSELARLGALGALSGLSDNSELIAWSLQGSGNRLCCKLMGEKVG